jgi:hypothetical protein
MRIFSQDQGKQGLTEGVLLYAAQGSPRFDAEIAEKGHLWVETKEKPWRN